MEMRSQKETRNAGKDARRHGILQDLVLEILFGVSESDLKEVNGHERQQHQSNDVQIQLTAHQRRRQLLIPSSFQTDGDVQQSAQQQVFLDDVRLETEACPIQPDVEMTVTVEIVRFLGFKQNTETEQKKKTKKRYRT